jgi:hypothetical protein
MANETASFLSSYNKFMFSKLPLEGLFEKRADLWAISIHDFNNNPITSNIDETWATDSNKRKSLAGVMGWSPLEGDYSLGIVNQALINFNYVPSGETWVIYYYIVWGVVNNNSRDNYYSIYRGEFNEPITLSSLQVLQFPPNTFKIKA